MAPNPDMRVSESVGPESSSVVEHRTPGVIAAACWIRTTTKLIHARLITSTRLHIYILKRPRGKNCDGRCILHRWTETQPACSPFQSDSGSRMHAGGRGRPSLRDNDFFPEEVQRGLFAPEDFTLAFGAPVASPGGTFRAANLASAQVLGAMGRGIAHTIVDIAPCGLVIPHVHPRGEESILVIDGALDAAFASETGELVRNDALQPDDIFAIPQGACPPFCRPPRLTPPPPLLRKHTPAPTPLLIATLLPCQHRLDA